MATTEHHPLQIDDVTNTNDDVTEEIDLHQQQQPGATSYINQWEVYFGLYSTPEFSIIDLKDAAMHGRLRSCHFRSICWRVFLNCLPNNRDYWESTVDQTRQIYTKIKSRHIFDPHEKQKQLQNQDLQLENPLSQDDESNWSRFFKNNDVKTMIERDVHRTCPEMDFFHKTKVRKMLSDILFCYACEHPVISYKQGMHELLAPLLFVLHCDLQGFAHASELGTIPGIISHVLDNNYLEHDAYDMFSKLMLATNSWYSSNGVPCTTPEKLSTDDTSIKPFNTTTPHDSNGSINQIITDNQQNTSPLIITKKLTFIHHHLLNKHDRQLYLHLEHLQIIPQVYGLRWIRLLFGREFVLQDLLVLWDAIFADSYKLDLVDYLFTAMMHHIRDKLLGGDYCQCMQVLMKYPPTADVYDLVELALHYRNPQKHGMPISSIRRNNKIQQQNINNTSGGAGDKKKSTNLFKLPLKMENPFSTLGRDIKKSMSSINRQSSNDKTNNGTTDTSTTTSSAYSRINVMKNFSNIFDAVSSETTLMTSSKSGDVTRNNKQEVDNQHYRKLFEDLERKCRFCAQQIDDSIKLLQINLMTSSFSDVIKPDDTCDVINTTTSSTSNDIITSTSQSCHKEETYMALASLKQVRDILRGNLNISQYVKSQNIPTSPSLDDLTDSELFASDSGPQFAGTSDHQPRTT